ncbi:hypothetical protein [Yinghuangia sp. YIM S10712]|uniref:hypothetical protein n=1 Tax=Yinghuangia sp. YIM S10712 TaxID=3436930 RepID=UPI003F535C68
MRYSGCEDSRSWKHFHSKYPFPLPPDARNINYCVSPEVQGTSAWLRFEAEETGVRQFLERLGAPQEQAVAYTDPEHYNFDRFVPGDLVLGRTYGRTDVERGPAGTSGSGYSSDILIDRDRGAPHTLTVFINIFAT